MTIAQRIYGAFTQQNLLKTFLLLIVLTVILLYLISWPGAIIAAAIAGFFVKRYSRAALVGFLGGFIAWGILVGIHAALGGIVVLELFGALAGLEGMGTALAVIIILIGGLLGLAGSLLGNTIFSFAEQYFLPSSGTTD
ncbi:MAG: hypothetical protein ACFFBR_03625 [Promethearchaeota archaeon]